MKESFRLHNNIDESEYIRGSWLLFECESQGSYGEYLHEITSPFIYFTFHCQIGKYSHMIKIRLTKEKESPLFKDDVLYSWAELVLVQIDWVSAAGDSLIKEWHMTCSFMREMRSLNKHYS